MSYSSRGHATNFEPIERRLQLQWRFFPSFLAEGLLFFFSGRACEEV